VFFVVPAVVMGTLYLRKKTALAVITAGIMTVLAELVAGFALSALLGINMNAEMASMVQDAINNLPAVYQDMLPANYAQDLSRLIIDMIPIYMIISAFYFVMIAHMLTRRVLRNRSNIALPKMKPMREWMLPRALVFYYLIALVLNMFIDTDQDTAMNMILVNLIPLLNIAFSVQAFCFLCFIVYQKGWNRGLLVLAAVAVLFLPPLSLLGVFDTAFPIRQRFKNQQK
jgi:uncharacterized protein YybS (DUF2232 family)